MDGYKLRIVTPDGSKFDDYIKSLIVRTVNGDVCILKDHTDYIGTVEIGRVEICKTNEERLFATCHDGFLNFSKNIAELIATTFEFSADIDVARAENAKERAEKTISDNKDVDDVELAKIRLKRALNRLAVSKLK